ncbi:MAG TPA: hypothetical protein VF516_12225 [Kofleriaceae bacterium]
MARLSAKRRAKIPTSKFAIKKGRKYPVDTAKRARVALGLVGMHGSAAQKKAVRSAVRRRYPSIGRR